MQMVILMCGFFYGFSGEERKDLQVVFFVVPKRCREAEICRRGCVWCSMAMVVVVVDENIVGAVDGSGGGLRYISFRWR